jgi:thiosulfate reductase / polysulfide reductase chain A
MNVIIGENRYDAAYIEKYATGFDELKAHVADKTPEWAYPLTGLKPDLLRESARFIAEARPASLIHPGRHTTWYGDDTQRERAIAILAALLGSWGRRGGYLLPSSMEVPKFPYTKYAYRPKAAADKPTPEKYPLAGEALASGLCDATINDDFPYNLKGWIVYGSNLIQSLPNPRQTIDAIQKLDFIVAIDVLPAEICGWADVVLPESTYLERCDDVWTPARTSSPSSRCGGRWWSPCTTPSRGGGSPGRSPAASVSTTTSPGRTAWSTPSTACAPPGSPASA